ncbi:MAG TPA: ATP-binding protein [Bryobacteraceae bacterium]|nr:ATP-binding protein [Bryobacteraceae bacterium]
MSTQARLTLSSVLVMTAIVAIISVLDLGYEMDAQYTAALEHAELLKRVASNMVVETLNRDRQHPWRQALSAPNLQRGLIDVLSASHALLEIAVCDANNKILLDSDAKSEGKTFPYFQDFEPIAKNANWYDKLRILQQQTSYQLSQPLGSPDKPDKPQLYVRIVIYPAFIKAKDIMPTLKKSASVALASVAGALCITLLFSFIAFRPLGRLGHLLDTVAKGEYDPNELAPVSRSGADEFKIMASKVSLLGQQLRGAKYDFSDLRGNFERLLDQLEDAVLMFGRDRRLVVASGAIEKFLGKMRADLVGCALAEVFPPNTTLGLLLAQAAQTGRAIANRRVPITRSDGSGGFVVLLSVDILEPLGARSNPGRGTGLLVRLRDPEAARQVGRQLQTADRLSAISRITSGVAHEVKNPLNAILMHVELARMKLARQDTDVAPQMEIISREILRLDRVVKTFLDFTRPVELHVSEVSLDSFVRDILELAAPQAEAAGIHTTLTEDADGVHIRVDADLMKQAILNVVVNAIQSMPQGGELRIECTVHEEEAEIRISDTGTGIPPELREKIFRLYFTTKPEGSGIGLAMTFRVVQLHDGTIDFTSEPGKGTTFVVRLPVAV